MSAAEAVISTVGPGSTTATMAGQQPLELATPHDIPGGFPETPANELSQPFGVKPLPAADGAVNPISLPAGQKIPDDITAQSTTDHVKLDKESYEKSDALAGVDVSIPPASATMIPEAGLSAGAPGNATISTVGAGATTTTLAGQVPLEPKVPKVVQESQAKAEAEPEASAIASEVDDKARVEDELKATIPVAPSTSEGTAGVGTEKQESANTNTVAGNIAAAAASAGSAIANAAFAAKNAVAPAASSATVTAKDDVVPAVSSAAVTAKDNVVPAVSAAAVTVKDNVVPAVSSAAITAKDTVVPAVSSAAATARDTVVPAVSSATYAAADVIDKNTPEAIKERLPIAAQYVKTEQPKEATRVEVSPEVPVEVKESIVEANKSPEAAANTVAVVDKMMMEEQLKKEVKTIPAEGDSKAIEASPAVTTAATPAVAPVAAPVAAPVVTPVVTEPVAETPANGSHTAASATGNGATASNGKTSLSGPASDSKPEGSVSTTEQKKKNRLSGFFSKIKHKISDKN